MKLIKQSSEKGFTLIEMLVIAPIVILAIGAFLTVIISMTGEVIASRGSNALAYNIQDALNRIEQDIKLSSTSLARNSVKLTAGEAQGYNNDATYFTNVGGTSGTSLILSTPVTNGNPLSATTGIVYLADKPNSCSSSSVRENTPMTMNVVYFVKDNTLWRRAIMPSNYATGGIGCSAPWQQPTCAPGYTAVFCKTEDTKLVEGVTTTLSVQYFSDAGATVPNATASNSGASVTSRNAALFATPTVGVSISASQSIAGRTIERSATLRASRVETTASAIGNPSDDTTPGAPVPTGSYKFSAPSSTTFTWPAVTGGNVTYTLNYNIDGGSWINALTNSSLRKYTIDAGANNVTVNVRVQASNSAGTSGYGNASYTTPVWVPPDLRNGWRNYDNTYNKPGITKTSAGVVMLRGLIAGGTASAGADILYLPDGYRPQYNMTFETITNANVYSRVYINASAGIVYVQKADTGWLSLDGIFFTPSTNLMTYNPAGPSTPAPFYNSWTNLGGVYPPIGYGTDSVGRVWTRGLGTSGSFSAGSRIVELPSAYLPSSTGGVLITPAESGAYADIQISAPAGSQSPGIQIAHGGSSWVSVQSMYYPSSFSGWSTLTLQNSWVYYGTPYSTARYTKASDGIVSLSGLIKSGSTTSNAIIATLPSGYRPSSGITLYGIASGNVAMGRVDIDTDGNIKYIAGGNAWLSLDGIHFIGE